MSPNISQEPLDKTIKLIEENATLQQEINNLAAELSNRYEELNLIYTVCDNLKISNDLISAIKEIIKEASNILPGHTAVLSLPPIGIFEYVTTDARFSIDELTTFVECVTKRYGSGENYFVVNTLNEFIENGFKYKNWFKLIAARVKIKDDHKGMLTIFNDSGERDYTAGDLKLLSVIAHQLSVIITTDELYRNLKDFLLNFVKSMVAIIEAKDKYTRGHSERVNRISVMIAKAMGLPPKDIENIHWASILHDIGKIGISDNILTKPARLTEEECNLIKTHPMKGHEILKHIIQLKDALQGIMYHQESYDGSGYPEGLKGKEIPLYARIIAVADTYDAITSSRAYRPQNLHINAMKEIERVSGFQLDPDIVEIFKKVCDDHPDFIRRERIR